MVAQKLFEVFVFEGGQRLKATNLRVDRRRQGHGGARELPVLCLAGGIGEMVLMPQAPLLRVPAPDVLGQGAIVGELERPPMALAPSETARSWAASQSGATTVSASVHALMPSGRPTWRSRAHAASIPTLRAGPDPSPGLSR